MAFVAFTNLLSYHQRLFLFIALFPITLFLIRSYIPTLLTLYIVIVLVRNIRFEIGGTLFYVFDFFVLGLILVFLGIQALSKEKKWRRSGFNKFVFLFIGACLAGTVKGFLVGSLSINVLHETIYYTLYIGLFFIVFNSITDKSEIKYFIWLLLITAFLLCVLGVFEYLKATGYTGFVQYQVRTRIRSTLGNANIYAGFLELIIPLSICFLLVEKNRSIKAFLIALVALGYVNLFMTFSRGGFVSALISLFIILFFRVKKRAYSFIVLGFIILVIIAASAFIARQLAIFNVETALVEGSVVARVISYSGNLKTIFENPIFGIGWGARFGYSPYGYYEPSYDVIYKFGHGNSTFFDIFVHLGVVGLLAYYAMIFALLANLYKQARTIADPETAALPWGLFAGFTGLTFHLLFDGFIKWPAIGSVFWILAGLAFANWYLYKKQSE
ncbi:MAG: O-antigen ligase family protein [Candidatus Coatesbacteria bacterium]|nr:MAG: O-antigen ligase family protein [Candidatus Coatesbacteria bacterium]